MDNGLYQINLFKNFIRSSGLAPLTIAQLSSSTGANVYYWNGKKNTDLTIQRNIFWDVDAEVFGCTTNTVSLGSSIHKWSQLHCTEITTYTQNFLRSIFGDYDTFWRNDGYNLYLLLTASGDQTGSFTTARPLQVNLSTGVCTINGNANSATYATTQPASDNSTKIATTAFVKSQGYVSLTSLAGGTTAGTMASTVGTMLFAYISQPTNNYANVSGSQVYAAIITATSDGIVSMSKSTTAIGVGTWRMLGISAGYYSINYCMAIRVV